MICDCICNKVYKMELTVNCSMLISHITDHIISLLKLKIMVVPGRTYCCKTGNKVVASQFSMATRNLLSLCIVFCKNPLCFHCTTMFSFHEHSTKQYLPQDYHNTAKQAWKGLEESFETFPSLVTSTERLSNYLAVWDFLQPEPLKF